MIFAVPFTVPLVAVIVAEPVAIAVASPPAEMVATPRALDPQVMGRPVNTLPLETMSAFQAHGIVARSVDRGIDEARATMSALEELGLDFAAVTQQLEDEGVALFVQSYDELIAGVEKKRRELRVAR